MRHEEYREWLQGKISIRPISDYISRCRRIEQSLDLDLDEEYQRDGGRSLVTMLGYSADDEKQKRSIPSGLEFSPGSNIRKGMASLRSAVKKYFEFCRS